MKNTPNSVRLEYTHSRLYLSNYYSKTFGNPRQEARRLSKYFSYTTATILHDMCHTASNCTQNVQIITVYVNSLEMRIKYQSLIKRGLNNFNICSLLSIARFSGVFSFFGIQELSVDTRL